MKPGEGTIDTKSRPIPWRDLTSRPIRSNFDRYKAQWVADPPKTTILNLSADPHFLFRDQFSLALPSNNVHM
jgi:hypothetical protein